MTKTPQKNRLAFAITDQQYKQAIDALTKGSHRESRVREAFDQNLFFDLRLMEPALKALDDRNNEVANFVAKTVLPVYGKSLLPRLKEDFKIKGGQPQARRLILMHQLDASGTKRLVFEAASSGSAEVKVAAIECLGDHPESFELLQKFRDSKNWQFQQTALRSISRLKTKEANSYLLRVMDGPDLHSLRQLNNKALGKEAIRRSQEILARLPQEKSRPERKNLLENLNTYVFISSNGNRPAVHEQFVIDCLDRCELLAEHKPKWSDSVVHTLVEMAGLGTKKCVNYLIQNRDRLPAEQFEIIADAARKWLKPSEFFTQFSRYFKPDAPSKSADAVRNNGLMECLYREYSALWRYLSFNEGKQDKAKLDREWIDLAIKKSDADLILELAQPNHPSLIQYLDAQWQKNKKREPFQIFSLVEAMVRAKHRDAENALLMTVQRKALGKKFDPDYQRWLYLLSYMPDSARQAISELLKNPMCNAEAKRQIPKWLAKPYSKYFSS